jgi:recombination protein RecA
MFNAQVKKVLDVINKKFGKGTIMTASTAKYLKLDFFSSGILSLDIELGGGWPEGRISMVIGSESSGKSTLAYLAGKQYLDKYPKSLVCIADTERTLLPKYLGRLGYTEDDLDRTLVVYPDSGEQAGEAVLEVIRQTDHCLIVLDSIAAMVPTREIEDDLDKKSMGQHAALVGQFFRKIQPTIKVDLESEAPKTTLVMTNQIRENIGVMWGKKTKDPGGRAPKHYTSIRLELARKAWLRPPKKGNEIQPPHGMTVVATVDKNKITGRQQNSTEFDYYYEPHRPIDHVKDIRQLGVKNGIIEVSGKSYAYGDLKTGKGKDDFSRQLAGLPMVMESLKADIMVVTAGRMYAAEEAPVKEAKKPKAGKGNSKKVRRKTATKQRGAAAK